MESGQRSTDEGSSLCVGWFMSAAGCALVGQGLVGDDRECPFIQDFQFRICESMHFHMGSP